MLPIFNKKNRKNPKLEGKESTYSTEDLFNEPSPETREDLVRTELSIHPAWDIPKEDLYTFQFLNQECSPMKPNQLAISGINVAQHDEENSFQFAAFIRNSLDKKIKLKEAKIVLIGANEQIIGQKRFNLSEVGDIPPKSSRPWTFEFMAEDLVTEEIPKEGWKLAFQLNLKPRKNQLDLSGGWAKLNAAGDMEKLKEMVNNLKPPKVGEVNFLGLRAGFTEEGALEVTMLIRNGSEKNMKFEQLPLQVEDAHGEIVAKGAFTFDQFEVKANTSKPWNFLFPKSKVLNPDADLSRWKAYAPKEAIDK